MEYRSGGQPAQESIASHVVFVLLPAAEMAGDRRLLFLLPPHLPEFILNGFELHFKLKNLLSQGLFCDWLWKAGSLSISGHGHAPVCAQASPSSSCEATTTAVTRCIPRCIRSSAGLPNRSSASSHPSSRHGPFIHRSSLIKSRHDTPSLWFFIA